MTPTEWAEKLEALRRSVDLRLDFEGRWYHEGEVFEHARLTALFNRGIDAHPETGEPIVHIGDRWCYFTADDTPFIVRRLEATEAGLRAHLNNEESWPVPPEGFEASGDHVYVQLTPTRRARLDRTTQNRLWGWLSDTDDIVVGTRRWPLRG
jgi:hypothetical protein